MFNKKPKADPDSTAETTEGAAAGDEKGKKKAKVSLRDLFASAKKTSRKLVIIAVSTLVVIACAMVAAHNVSAKSHHVKKPVEHGPVITLDEFLVNLADPSGDHYLKVTVAVEIDPATGKTAETMKDQVPIIRDAVLTAITSKTRDQIDSNGGRENLKNEIKTGVNQALGQNVISQVYFTNFVTQ